MSEIENTKDCDFVLVVLGDPRPQGRPRAAKRGGFVQVYEDKKDRNAKASLVATIQHDAPASLLDCPLRVDLLFYLPRPRAHYGTGRNASRLKDSSPLLHTKKPDIDNLRKLVMDAMTGVFWRDDSLVCDGRTQKFYSDKPRTEIYIKAI